MGAQVLSPECHNTLWVFVSLAVLGWAFKLFRKWNSISVLRAAHQRDRVILMDGIVSEFAAGGVIHEQHFRDLMRTHRAVPDPVPVKKFHVPLHVDRASVKSRLVDGGCAVSLSFTCTVPTYVQAFWGVKLTDDNLAARGAYRLKRESHGLSVQARGKSALKHAMSAFIKGLPPRVDTGVVRDKDGRNMVMPVFPDGGVTQASVLELYGPGEKLVYETRLSRDLISGDLKRLEGVLSDANFSHSPHAQSFPLVVAFFNDDMHSDTSPCQLVCVEFDPPPAPPAMPTSTTDEESIVVTTNQTDSEMRVMDEEHGGIAPSPSPPASTTSEGVPDTTLLTNRASPKALWCTEDEVKGSGLDASSSTSPEQDRGDEPSLVTNTSGVPPWFASATVLKMLAATNEHVYDIQEVFGSREDTEESDCVVCLTVPMNTILLPCRHLCVCDACFRMIDKCPICRADFTGFLKYLPDKELS